MAEPTTTTTAGGVALAAGTITMTGSIFGLQYDALLFGLAGSLMSLMHLPPDHPALRTMTRTAAMLFLSTFFAGVLSPLAAPALHGALEWTHKIPAEPIRLAAAALIGLGLLWAIPVAMKRMAALGGQS